MKKKIIFSAVLLLALAAVLLLALSRRNAWHGVDNTAIYEHYAAIPGLEVAQLIHYPIGDSMFVNGVMIHADDSAQWDSLLTCFNNTKEHMEEGKKTIGPYAENKITLYAGDRQHPEQKAPMKEGKVDFDNACDVFLHHFGQTLWIFHYANEAEHDQLIILYLDKITTGEIYD